MPPRASGTKKWLHAVHLSAQPTANRARSVNARRRSNESASLARRSSATLTDNRISVDLEGQRTTDFDPLGSSVPRERKWFEPTRDFERPRTGCIGPQDHELGDVVWFKKIIVDSTSRPIPAQPLRGPDAFRSLRRILPPDLATWPSFRLCRWRRRRGLSGHAGNREPKTILGGDRRRTCPDYVVVRHDDRDRLPDWRSRRAPGRRVGGSGSQVCHSCMITAGLLASGILTPFGLHHGAISACTTWARKHRRASTLRGAPMCHCHRRGGRPLVF